MDLDYDMLDIGSDTPTTLLTESNINVLNYIHSTFQNIINALRARPHGKVEVRLARNNAGIQYSNEHAERISQRVRGDGQRGLKYSWPGSTPEEAWRFACLVCILSLIRRAVLENITITKRDIYYHEPELFKRQETVDRFVDDIAYTCNVTRMGLRVVASPKGLVYGLSHSSGVQSIGTDSTARVSSVRWIMVIEKEASFKALVENSFHTKCSLGPGLLVTGKGYPDVATRQFLRNAIDANPNQPPVFGLVDGDPDGIDIYRCYVSGSRRSTQEDAISIPEMQWLGVDMIEFLGNCSVMNQCLPMTARDRTRARGMLARTKIAGDQDALEVRLRSMLQTMMVLGMKMEIQALDGLAGGGMLGWLDAKIRAMS